MVAAEDAQEQRIAVALQGVKKTPPKRGECKGNYIHEIITRFKKKGKTKMSELLKVEAEGFAIDTDAKAEWALQKIREAREDRDKWVAWYKDKIAEITEQTDFETMNLERMLSDYFATVPHKVTKTQESYKLPGGKLIRKTQNPEYKRDDKTVIEWLKTNNLTQFVKTKEELDWSELKARSAEFEGKLVTEDGEIIPGVEVVSREPKFVVEV